MELRIFVSLFGILFIGLLGVYALTIMHMRSTNSQLGKIYETINGHMLDTAVHVDPEHPFRTVEVCIEREKTSEVQFIALKDGQERIEKEVGRLADKLS